MDTPKQDKVNTEFVRLLTAYYSNIYAYIVSLVANFNDANDILQETTSTMWMKFSDFRPGTDFVAWGTRIAYFKVLDYRKKKRRDQKIIFSDDIFTKFAEHAPDHIQDSGKSVQKLRECIKKLQAADSRLVQLRFLMGLTIKDVSQRLNTSIRSIYYNLARVQGLLLNCMGDDE